MLSRFVTIFFRVLGNRAAWPVLLALALLLSASILAIGLSAPKEAAKQEMFALVGLAVLLVVIIPHYQNLGRMSYILFAVVLVLLIAVLLTSPINGSRRWFKLGETLQLQPSELAKVTYVLALAWFLRYRKNIDTFPGLFPPLALMLIPFSLIVIEPDIGTAMLFPAVTFAMLIAAGARLRHLTFVVLLGIFTIPTVYPLIPDYARKRLWSWTPLGRTSPQDNYQAFMSWVSIGSGGVTGDPSGADHIRQGMLPEAHTDFIFSCIGAQWGFVGCCAIIVLYLAFLAAAIEIATATKDVFARLTVIGLASMILTQALLNMAMTMGLAPVVGVALPFVSYGGSSLLTNMIAAGILLNVSVRRQSTRTLSRADYAMA